MNKKVYLDNNASAPLDPRVLSIVIQDLKEIHGNPSSIHSFGQEARNKLIQARHTIASSLGVKPHEIIFTSGGTEGANLLLRGMRPNGTQGHIITTSIEHACVYSTVKSFEEQGAACSYLETGEWGAAKPEAVKEALRPNTCLIALMAVNNETGVKTDISSIASIAKEAKVPFLVDGIALLGKESFVIPDGVSAMFFSGHKLHAPKGVGFAFIRSTCKFVPSIFGGEQEFSRRPGTENLSGIVGLAEAVNLLKTELPAASETMMKLREHFENELMGRVPGVRINGLGPRVPNTSNLAFDGVEGETLLAALDLEGIAVSHGSACASGALKPSRVLLNMGLSDERAASSLRISLSRFTTEEEINYCIEAIVRIVTRLRN